MLTHQTTRVAIAIVLLACLGLTERLSAQGASADEARIRKLVELLGDANANERERAQAELQKIGAPAVPALRAALESPDAERRMRAEALLAILARVPGEADLVALAESLTKALISAADDGAARDQARGVLAEFAKRFSPEAGVVTYATQDGKTLTVCLGSAATKEEDGSNAEVKADTQWVVAIGGAGLEFDLDELPSPDDMVPDGIGGSAEAEATQGIAVAMGGDGLLLRSGDGIAGGGSGGDAKAQSPVLGLALEGKDRTGSVTPPLDGASEGSGSLDAAKNLLSSPPK